MLIYLLTPSLGFLKNYIKYKKINFLTFLRTPLIYFILNLFFKGNKYKILIFERWLFFIFKIMRSYIRNDYIKNKGKYKEKYNIKYPKPILKFTNRDQERVLQS